jgi:hypothetical protein
MAVYQSANDVLMPSPSNVRFNVIWKATTPCNVRFNVIWKVQLSRLWKGHDLIAAGGRLDLTNKWSSLISLNRCNKVLAAHLVKIYPYLVWILCQLFSCFNCLIGFYPSLLKVKFFSWTFFCI